ncbi:DUF669 domain-containing protein [Streptococcus agalactiae]|uniref:DUF669 domain-containing protein n=1 Tax=Streptococcus agalactiae TaxID=1311 RepID=UPI0039C630FA
MSMLDIAKSIKKDGFDPRKDKVNNGNQNLPGGEYKVILKGAEARVADSGWESINYAFEVRDVDSDYNGRMQYIMFGTQTEWKKSGKLLDLTSMVETTIKFFQKAVILSGDTNLNSDFEDNKSMEEALVRKAVGSKFILVVDEFKKRNGETSYNYDLLEEFNQDGAMTTDIDDDDLPF